MNFSNSGHDIQSAVIEQVTKKSFVEYLNENIFGPLQMDHTQVTNLLSRPHPQGYQAMMAQI
ncbi:serine hydrolase [Microbulbifer variabilis]|uniref:serine hydrolase n=2 Tax=Microbulbifer TaxID=48073 RepID=UPI0003A7543C